jgi:membrane protease YdiL (CAAX protease family)
MGITTFARQLTSRHDLIPSELYKFSMPNSESSLVADASATGIMAQTEKRRRWLELGLVLLIAFGNALLYSLYYLKNGPPHDLSVSSLRYPALVLQQGSTLLLLAYVLARRGLDFGNIGLRWSPMDVGVGTILAVISHVVYGFGYAFIRTFHHALLGTDSTAKNIFGHPPLVLAVAFCLLNPLLEELVVRAYLMTEVIELTGSTLSAVIISVLVQFSYHLYYGWAGAISVSFQFLVYALYFAHWRRALPIVIAHGFFDVYGMFRLLGL